MAQSEVPACCLSCPHHLVLADPDPDDWFCDDDKAVVCQRCENSTQNLASRHLADRSAFRAVTVACRPYNLEKESARPSWCPLLAETNSSRLTVPEVLPLVKAYYAKPENAGGGALHLVLEDGNVQDCHVKYCLEQAEQNNDEAGAELARVLLQLTKTQRKKLSALR